LVSQCLKTLKQKKTKGDIDLAGLPDGAKAFKFINENLVVEVESSTVSFFKLFLQINK